MNIRRTAQRPASCETQRRRPRTMRAIVQDTYGEAADVLRLDGDRRARRSATTMCWSVSGRPASTSVTGT